MTDDMPSPEQRTPEEIEKLKTDWIRDPCWDIEATPDFEAHHDELLAWRLAYEREEDEKQAKEDARRELAARERLVKVYSERQAFRDEWLAALTGAMATTHAIAIAVARADSVVLLLADQRDEMVRINERIANV